MKIHFIINGAGKKIAVVLPIKAFKKLVKDKEELEDVRLYDQAKRSAGKAVPVMDAFRQIEAKRKNRRKAL